MEASKNSLERILTAADRLRDAKEAAVRKMAGVTGSGDGMNPKEEAYAQEAKALVAKYEAAMEDDFNTADGVSVIFELVKLSNTTVSGDSSPSYIAFMEKTLHTLCDVLGINTVRKTEVLEEEIEDLIRQRQEARKIKNFSLADEIRGKLLDMGIVLEDTREGVKWKKA